MKDLLDLRKRLNRKRPCFERCDSYKRKEVSPSWRRPKGLQNKMRLQRHGKPAVVKTGYRSPSAVRGLSASGLTPVNVYSLCDLNGFDSKVQGVILGRVGCKKKVDLLEKCKKKGFAVLNVKDVDAEISRLNSLVELRRKAKAAKSNDAEKAARKEKKVEKKQDSEKKKEESKEVKEEGKDAKTREQEKKDMERVLTKRQ